MAAYGEFLMAVVISEQVWGVSMSVVTQPASDVPRFYWGKVPVVMIRSVP